jgi:IS30 family transposase
MGCCGSMPKGTNVFVLTEAELDAIPHGSNSRPRATHAFHYPIEVFAAILKSAHQPTTSTH